jgi:DNA-binding winged helix-turn-helix (wHTH) protein/tetratricopeptide (TPR) repeat protein
MMPDSYPPTPRYRFGPFELNPAEGSLARNGTRVKLQDLPYRLLVMLVERPGQIVTRDEVRQRLWPQNTFVEFDNSLGVAIRKIRDSLGDDAETPRYIETIPRRGYRFRAPVTVQETDKTAETENPIESTSSQVATVTPVGGVTSPPSTTRLTVFALLALLLIAAALYAFRWSPRRATAKSAEIVAISPHVRRSVAVLGFRNLRGRPQDNWLSAAFSEMLNTELAAGGELRLVSGEDVARAKSELPLTDEDTLALSTLKRLHVDPGADVVVLGSYTPLPGSEPNRLRLDIRVQETAAGETLGEESVVGSEEDLLDLVTRASSGVRNHLGLNAGASQATMMARASLPSNQEAVRFYTEGRARAWAFDFAGARNLLLKAVAADPVYPLTHEALSQAWERLGYDAKARAEAQLALDRGDHLPPEERLLVQGHYWETMSNFPKAVETYQTLFNLFPDNLEYGLHLASAQLRVKSSDCLRTLDALRRLPAPEGEDPRIDLVEASAWIDHDMTKAHLAAERAITKGSAQGSHFLVARAYGVLCQQGGAAATTAEEALTACENARQSYAAAGDRNNEARALNDFAGLYFQRGDLTRAEAMWRQAAPVFQQIGAPQGRAAVANNLGDVFLLEGKLDEADKFLRQAIPDYQATDDKAGVAGVLSDLGNISRQRGNLEAAVTTYQQAKATAAEIDDKSVVAYALNGLGDTLADRGDLVAARKSYEESLALRNQAGEKQTVAETEIALARLSIEEGRAAEAETVARKCRDQFHQDLQTDDELAASLVLIQASLGQEKQADAQKELEAAQPLAANTRNILLRLQFELASGRVARALGNSGPVRRSLQQVIQEARRRGFLSVDLEAQLTLAQLSAQTKTGAPAREQLVALEKEARAKGFGLIARKAAASLPPG